MLATATGAVFAPSFGLEADTDHLWTMAIFFAGSWMVLSIVGYRQIKTANQAAIYITTGRLDLAETQLRDAVLAFNLHPRGKLMACHNLAVVAHNQKDFMAEYAHRQISRLSGGQQQRVFLARALVQDAQLYLMDEPFAGVDAATESAIIALLKDLKARGRTVLVVHHDLQTVKSYFDDVILLNMRIVASGPTATTFTEENLRKTYGGKLTLLVEAAEAIARGGQENR